ncbi:hypothetical protein [Adhaeribacter aquaticus]|uniref:hypothetical protein n=1 Tax=Adhaeribacter aquaticus TaxID=299567 RepID=UPI00040805C7|nr:hypothetical protein [Adhaeribacter aquaticus]
MNNIPDTTELFEKEMQEFKTTLQNTGILSALGYLNQRTPHRYTGIYRYDGKNLQNLYLFDKFSPDVVKGEDVPINEAFCSMLVKEHNLEFADVNLDERVRGKVNTTVISYCGVLIEDAAGNPFGSLCHFDMKSCQERVTDLPLLQAASSILYRQIAATC